MAVDLAAGTGLVSRVLAGHVERVVAIEPDPRMAAVLHARSGGAAVLRGVGEAIPLAAASTEAVVISSAWHWLDTDRAIPELARVIREGGRLGVLRTGIDQESGFLRELRRPSRSDHDYQIRDRTGRYSTLPDTGQFGNAVRESFAFTRTMSADEFAGLLATYSEFITASEQDRAENIGRVRSQLDRIFPDGGPIEVPMRTRCWRADRVALARPRRQVADVLDQQPGEFKAVMLGPVGGDLFVRRALPAPETRQHLRAGLGQHQHGSWPGTTARTPRSRRWGSGRPARAGRGCLSRWACTGIIAVSATARRLPSPRRPRSGNWVRRARSCARQAPMSVPWRPTGQPASSSSPSGGTCAVALYAGYWRAAWRLSSRTGINGAFRAAGLAVSMIVDHRDRISGI